MNFDLIHITIEYIDGGKASWTASKEELYTMIKHDEEEWFDNDYVVRYRENYDLVDLKLNSLTQKIESVKFLQKDRYNKW